MLEVLEALKENFEDAMAITKKYGKPDLFITFTCDPKWSEITENLYPGQTANDRPGLVTRRGLPHVHTLLHFANDDKLETAHVINSLISAEIPDPIVNRDLYDVVKTCMIHGPCGILNTNSPCMKDGVCSKILKNLMLTHFQVSNSFTKSQYTLGVFVDLSKAIDTANHYILLNELEFYGITDIPYHFIFDDKDCKWKTVPLQAKGATSWEDVRTVNSIVFEMFREACVLKVLTHKPKQIRQLFSIILTFCEPDNPLDLWVSYKAFMMEDFIQRSVQLLIAEQATLRQIEKIINQSGKTLADFNMPVIDEFMGLYLENFDENI
ncbi:uncharacterized protein LOC136081151 [Hydra vulgaris]|uniref:Uncharacterized protein LOC136081151 n=1 Tax=Hydra vulgaris TaxID=6087 RepID=A0ABM4BZ35_HYDVU